MRISDRGDLLQRHLKPVSADAAIQIGCRGLVLGDRRARFALSIRISVVRRRWGRELQLVEVCPQERFELAGLQCRSNVERHEIGDNFGRLGETPHRLASLAAQPLRLRADHARGDDEADHQ